MPNQYMNDPSRLLEVNDMISKIQAMSSEPPAVLEPILEQASEVITSLQLHVECLQTAEKIASEAKKDTTSAISMLQQSQQVLQEKKFIDHAIKMVYKNDLTHLYMCIKFLESIPREAFSNKIQAIQKLYVEMCENGHNVFAEVLVLQNALNLCLADEEEEDRSIATTKDELEHDENRLIKIVATEIAEGGPYSLLKSLHSVNLLNVNVSKIMGALKNLENSPLVITQRLIKSSVCLSNLPTTCAILQALQQELNMDNDQTNVKEKMNIWAHLTNVAKSAECMSLDDDDPSKVALLQQLDTLSLLVNDFIKIYQNLVESSDCYRLDHSHIQNDHLLEIIPHFVNLYYDGNQQKTFNVLRAARSITDKNCSSLFLNKLGDLMFEYGQTQTYDYFALFCVVKHILVPLEQDVSENSVLRDFRRLKSFAPPSLGLILWPKEFSPHGIILSNPKGTLGALDAGSVVCGQNGSRHSRRISSVWRAIVSDSEAGLVAFKAEAKENRPAKYLSSTIDAKEKLTISEVRSLWRVRAIDDNNISICSTTGKFYFLCFKWENFSKGILRSF